MKRILSQIIPIFVLALVLMAISFGIVLLAYLMLVGISIALILYSISWIREKIFRRKTNTVSHHKSKTGRIFDSTDWERR